MYEERREKFSFKSFFLTLLLVVLFILLMLWIFPTRWDVNKLQSTYDLERLSVLYDEIFANNVARMKDAAIGYFTNERMPQTVGETKKLTLQQMYDLHLVLKMKDKDGNYCDAEKSYVEMTKYTEEYRLKVNLSCGDYEDYIIVYLGCYDYCNGICEKRVSTPSAITKKEEAKVEPTPNKPEPVKPQPEKNICVIIKGKYYDANGNAVSKEEYKKSCGIKDDDPTPITKKYMYEYKLVVDDVKTCDPWTNWQKDFIESTELVKVETKKEQEIKGYVTTKVQDGTKTETKVTKVPEKYVSGYITKLVVVDTKQVPTGKTTTKTITEEVVVDYIEEYQGIDSGTKVPKDTKEYNYEVISSDKPSSCSYCEDETIYTWEIWKIEPVYDVVTRTEKVPVYKTVKIYEEQEVPVYDYKIVEKKETITVPVYKEIKTPEYHDVTYYRSKTCTIKKGYTDIKWSYDKLDTKLIGKGYKLTGKVVEV